MPPNRVNPKLRIQLQQETSAPHPPLTRWLPAQLRKLALLAGVKSGTLTIVVVDDARMAELHLQYSRVPGTTDVLTFDLRETFGKGRAGPGARFPKNHIEGDIVVCLDVADREAKVRRRAVRLEVLLYALHGLLHLIGYDDHTPSDYQSLHRREDLLLTQAGIGPLFTDGFQKHRKAGAGVSKKHSKSF